jgi:hypothetical protein
VKTKAILLTFDYELFLGEKSGSVRDCLIDPTNRLREMFSASGLKAIFFVDTVYLLRLQELVPQYPRAASDWVALQEQLTGLVSEGHYIFPHVHPHWLDAVYQPDRNEWSLTDTRYYAFSSLSGEQRQRLFDESVAVIRSLVPVGYAIDAYRAGGWSIQPFGDFRPHFLRHGIVHEWSVIPGRYHVSSAHQFDFRKAPVDRPVYRFDDDVCVSSSDGPFTEWTISCLNMTPRERWLDFKVSGVLQRVRGRQPLSGSTVQSVVQEEGDLLENAKTRRILASFERLNPFRVMKYRAAIRKAEYFQFISHPKMLTGYDLKLMGRLLRYIGNDPAVESDFRKLYVQAK